MASTLPSLVSRQLPLASSSEQLAMLHRLPVAREFTQALDETGLIGDRDRAADVQPDLRALPRRGPGPKIMTRETMAQSRGAEAYRRPTVDVTAVQWSSTLSSSSAGLDDRCNLTVLGLPSQADLADFLAEQRGGRAQHRQAAGRRRVRQVEPVCGSSVVGVASGPGDEIRSAPAGQASDDRGRARRVGHPRGCLARPRGADAQPRGAGRR